MPYDDAVTEFTVKCVLDLGPWLFEVFDSNDLH